MTTASPYLSVVATARNDNHGGDLLYRMQLFIDALAAQCDRHGVALELVLVEWNPPADRPRLEDALDWPRSEHCGLRIVEVPRELHARLRHSDRLPLFQMIAKNVGIRRARGEFVLATNVDVLLSDGAMEAIAGRRLEHDVVYRTDRHDVSADIPLDAGIEEQLRLCAGRVLRVCERTGTRDLRTGDFYSIYHRLPWWAAPLQHGYWFLRQRARSLGGRSPGTASPAPVVAAAGGGGCGSTAYYRRRLYELWLTMKRDRLRIYPHTNASGDFTLMSRDAWFRLRGYPELEVFSMHLDGLLLVLAHYAGIREEQLAAPVYHIDHASGFKPDAASVHELSTRVASAGLDTITDIQMLEWTLEMARRQAPLQFNSPDWGFAGTELPERVVGATLAAQTTKEGR